MCSEISESPTPSVTGIANEQRSRRLSHGQTLPITSCQIAEGMNNSPDLSVLLLRCAVMDATSSILFLFSTPRYLKSKAPILSLSRVAAAAISQERKKKTDNFHLWTLLKGRSESSIDSPLFLRFPATS